jgi:arylsulfatase A-like enzyme
VGALAACGRKDATQVAARPADLAPAAPPLPPARRVLDLITNRPRAHVYRGAFLTLDGGPGLWKYVDGGWKSSWAVGVRDGERRVALVLGVAGVVRLFDDGGAGDRKLVFTLKPGAPRQSLSLFVNEQPAGNLAIGDDYQRYEVRLPGRLLRAGENALRFHFRAAGELLGKHSAAAFDELALGPADAAPPPPGAPSSSRSALGAAYAVAGDSRPALATEGAGRFAYHLVLPRDALRLRAHVGTQGEPTTAVVRVHKDGEAPRELWRGPVARRWQPLEADLATYAGEAVRLELELLGAGAFAEPTLVAPEPGPSASAEAPRGRAADHVIVWMVDTLRADKLSSYNAETRVKTPAFALLAREGARFASATVQGNYSLPSHASLLTGVYPSVHHMTEDTARLDAAVQLVSQTLKEAGRATAMFSSNGYISDKWGFKKGWDGYRNFIRENLPNSADYVWKHARPWLEEQVKAGKKTFMYLLTVDPHVAYNPPAQFLKPYWDKKYGGPVKPLLTAQQLAQIKLGHLKLGPVDKQYLEALYDAEVAQNDSAFAQVVADLKQLGLYDTTALVLVSDHGDEFFEHGSVGHGHSVYQELVDVPLVLRYPPLVPAGVVVPTDIEVLDVAPTLLELAGLPTPPTMQGESLVALARDPAPHMPRPAVSAHGQVLRGVRLGRYKLVTSAAKTQLFDLAVDPHEQRNLADGAAARPVALRALRDAFAFEHAYEDVWHKAEWGVASDLKPAFADAVEGAR